MGGEKSWKTVGFYPVSVKTDFKETSEQKLTVWNIWTFFKQSNLLTSIRVSRSLLRCCFQAWYKMREKRISERKITSFGVSAPHCTFLPSWPEWFRCCHRRSDGKESGLGSEPKPAHVKPGERFWAAAHHLKLVKSSRLTWGHGWLGAVIDLCLQWLLSPYRDMSLHHPRVRSPLPALQEPNPALLPWCFGWALMVQLAYGGMVQCSTGRWLTGCQTR